MITVERGDQLEFIGRGSVSPANILRCTIRGKDKTGRAVSESVTLTASTDRSSVTGTTDITWDGTVDSASTDNVNTTIGLPAQPGIVYVNANLVRQGDLYATLYRGYLYNNHSPSYPVGPNEGTQDGPGRIYTVTGANPAAGAEASDAVPTAAKWRILGYSIVLVTAVAAANRLVQLVIDNGTSTQRIGSYGTTTAQTASLTQTHLFGRGNDLSYGTDTAITDTQTVNVRMPFPTDLILNAGDTIRTVTGALQAADDYATPFIRVEEWFEA